MQLILAPGLAWEVLPGHSIGAAPLFALQRFKAYGLQSFAAFSRHPTDVSNRGYDYALGIGARVGWLGRLTPWLDLGASYASKIYMGEFEHYDGLLADGGLDIPANYTIGLATRPAPGWTFTFDWQRIAFGGVRATGNGVLNTLVDPLGKPLGSAGGSGFNWEDQDNFRFGLAWAVRPTLTLRAGYAYGDRAQRDDGINSVTLNMMAPNALHQASVGCTWQPRAGHELHLAYSRYIAPAYSGPSATALLGIGGTERLEAHVDTVMVAWSWLR
jgi:long-chain fatty acid transport protein